MGIKFGQTSLERLATLKPALRRVVERAASLAAPEEDFKILEGVRTREQMKINYGKGRTAEQLKVVGIEAKYAAPKEAKVTWLRNPFNSKHAADPKDGLSAAVDVVPYPVDWNDLGRFNRLAGLMFRAAALEGVHIRWGADWDEDGKPREKGETDSPHFELA